MTAELPPAAVDATKEATTCYDVVTRLTNHRWRISAHLLEFELSGVDKFEHRCKPSEASALYPLGSRKKRSPSVTDGVDEQKQEDRGNSDLNRFEQIDLLPSN